MDLAEGKVEMFDREKTIDKNSKNLNLKLLIKCRMLVEERLVRIIGLSSML